MAISEAFTGQQAVDSTEWSCCTDTSYDTGDLQTTDGIYQVWLDLNDMVNTDILQINVYEKVTSSSTVRLAYQFILRDAQSEVIAVLPSLILIHGWDITLKAIAGTITIDWSIRKIA
jgi:hypothetical protein